MPNFPTSDPSLTPATHGEVAGEVNAIGADLRQIRKQISTTAQNGVKDDAVYTTVTSTAGSATVVTGTAVFTSTAVDAGKILSVKDGVAVGTHFLGKIATVTNSTTAVLTATVPLAKTAVECVFGTNAYSAIKTAMDNLSAAGGGVLLYNRTLTGTGKFFIDRPIRLANNVYHEAQDSSIVIIQRWSGGTNVHPVNKCVFIPGFVHGTAFWTSTNGTNPNAGSPTSSHYLIADVARGASSVTGSVGGELSANFAVGDFIAVRSKYAYTQPNGSLYDENPWELYFSRVVAKSGDTLTLEHNSPYDITTATHNGASVVKINNAQNAPGRWFSGDANFAGHGQNSDGYETMWMCYNTSIDGFTLDAPYPVWGGGAIRHRINNIRPTTNREWNSFITLNSMCDTIIENCQEADFYYTWAELKHGSGNVEVRNCKGQWIVLGGLTYTPVGIGESSHNIRIHSNDITLSPSYNDYTRLMFYIQNCQDIEVYNNDIRVNAIGLDAVFGIAASSSVLSIAEGVSIRDNRVYISGASTTGTHRLIKIGDVSAGQTVGPKRFQFLNNRMGGTGLRKDTANEWINMQVGEDVWIEGNIIPAGSHYDIGPKVSGVIDASIQPRGANVGVMCTKRVAIGWLAFGDTVNKTIGRMPRGAVITNVIVEIQTAFNGTGSNTLSVAHEATANFYVNSFSAAAVGVFNIEVGHAQAGTGLGKKLGGMSVTNTRNLVIKYNGTSPSTGLALIMVEFISVTPDSA